MASSLGTPYKRNAIMETIKTQRVDIPRLGFGTFRMPDGEAQPVVESAIALSFRHIDTAVIYENATAVDAAIAALGVKRAKLFVRIKAWHHQLPPDALRRAFDISLGKLGLDYVDFHMIHWPNQDMDMAATLEALMGLRERGLTRAIGVCKINLPMIRRAVEEIGAPIATRRVEYYPFLLQAADARLSAQQGHSVASMCAESFVTQKLPVLTGLANRLLPAAAFVLRAKKSKPGRIQP
jgi:2,5-diketo-D-gluconate reductase B